MVLSIETSVQGGSISLLEKDRQVDFWQGGGNISKSEDVLDEISKLLKKNAIDKNQIKQIVISTGPGSFTGTRIGLAIALGLQKSLNCDICGVSVLEAMAFESGWDKNIIAAIPIGANICIQKFEIYQKNNLNKIRLPSLISFGTFIKQLKDNLDVRFVVCGKLYKNVIANLQTEKRIVDKMQNSGENLAYLIGLFVKRVRPTDNLQPIYIKTKSCEN